MSDLVGLIAGIPGIVEGFVNTCRCVEAYLGADAKHIETITDAMYYSRKLKYYARFIDRPPNKSGDASAGFGAPRLLSNRTPSADDEEVQDGDPISILEDSQDILYKLFQNALLSLSTAEKVVDDWTIRLKLDVDGQNHSRRSIAKLFLSIADRLARKDRSTDQKKTNALMSNFSGKTMLLVIGCQQIEGAMGRLKFFLDELRDILLVSPILCRHIDPELLEYREEPDDVLFVSIARDRASGTQSMETIKPDSLIALQPLDDRKHNLMIVGSEESPYHNCLVDRRNVLHLVQGGKEDQALQDTELIARLFAEERDELGHVVSASVGILPCRGFTRVDREHHDLVFQLPDGIEPPCTLRNLLLQGRPRHSLEQRLEFSIRLAAAVLIVHSLGLVHKDIRPDSIIVVNHASSTRLRGDEALGEPYLVGFNESRHLDSATVPLTVAMIQNAERRWALLYRHPRHLTSSMHKTSEMRDDIYSLGICLLEIGIWKSLFIWDEKSKIYVNDTSVCDLSQERYRQMFRKLNKPTNQNPAWLRQDTLVELAEGEVAVTMGNTFKEVVIECLTFGSVKRTMAETVEGKDLGRIGHQNQSVDFIKKVLSKLRKLKL